MSEEGEGPEGMASLPMDMEWLEEFPEAQQKTIRDMLDEFNTAMFYLSSAIGSDEESEHHQQAHLLVGFTDAMVKATLRITQMESARLGTIGLDPELMISIQRSLFGALLLAGIRYGQHHPDAYLAGGAQDLAAEVQQLLDGLTTGKSEEGPEGD